MENKDIFILIIAVIISLFIGNFIGMSSVSLDNYVTKDSYNVLEKNYNDSLNETQRYAKALNIFIPPIPEEIFSISGEIKEITSNYIILKTTDLTIETLPGEVPVYVDRKININDKTKVVLINPFYIPTNINDSFEIQQKTINFESLKVADRISVLAEENIKIKKEFIATEISIIEEGKFN